jgi:hypothetical protein
MSQEAEERRRARIRLDIRQLLAPGIERDAAWDARVRSLVVELRESRLAGLPADVRRHAAWGPSSEVAVIEPDGEVRCEPCEPEPPDLAFLAARALHHARPAEQQEAGVEGLADALPWPVYRAKKWRIDAELQRRYGSWRLGRRAQKREAFYSAARALVFDGGRPLDALANEEGRKSLLRKAEYRICVNVLGREYLRMEKRRSKASKSGARGGRASCWDEPEPAYAREISGAEPGASPDACSDDEALVIALDEHRRVERATHALHQQAVEAGLSQDVIMMRIVLRHPR